MKVVEIFSSIDGEGKRSGLPTTFIRLFGCNLNCTYCDTHYGKDKEYEDWVKEMSIRDIIDECNRLRIPNITITGGEPLIHEGIKDLIEALCNLNFWVNVETNGTIFPPIRHPNLFYTVDFKTNASGMSATMNPDVFKTLDTEDVVKCVVGSEDDMVQSVEFLKTFGKHYKPEVYFSPVFGQIEPSQIVNFLLKNRLYNYKVQLQMHKYIWDKDMRGV